MIASTSQHAPARSTGRIPNSCAASCRTGTERGRASGDAQRLTAEAAAVAQLKQRPPASESFTELDMGRGRPLIQLRDGALPSRAEGRAWRK